MHRSRRSEFLMHTCEAVRRPGDARRWAPRPQSLKCEAVRATNLVGSATRPCGDRQRPRQAKHRRTTGNRPGQAGHRLGAFPRSERMRSEQARILPGRPSRSRKRRARARAREIARLQRGGNGAKPEAADGKEAEGRTPAVAVNNGEWHERVARVMLASVAQQGVAPEPPPRGSSGCW